MSSTCKDKDAAWEFIRDMVMVDSKTVNIPNLGGLPISRTAYTTQTKDWYEPKMSVAVGSQSISAERETKEGLELVTAFLNSITRCSLFLEPAVLEMIEEQASAYFAGPRCT